MGSRPNLHEELCKILGSRNVYFTSPTSVKLIYPCIKYALAVPSIARANDGIYKSTDQYKITVIDQNPDSTIYKKILEQFQMCRIEQMYFAENLFHVILTLYY